MARIAVEALGIQNYGGGRTATLTLFESLFRVDPENEYLIFLSQEEKSLIDPYNEKSGRIKQFIVPIKNRFISRIWAQSFLPYLTRNWDLVHFSKNLGVFGISRKSVVTVYDLTTLIHPDLFPKVDVFYWQHIQKRTLYAASKIIAISNTTARDLENYYHLPKHQIEVIYPAIASHFKPASLDEIQRVKSRYKIYKNYIIHVGRIDPKKNLTVLIKSFASLLDQKGFNGDLVLVGEDYSKSPDHSLHPTVEKLGIRDRVIFTGRVPDEDLPPLYSGALAAVFPSIHEGFGLAPVEAMACGTPLIAHSAGALQEAVGTAPIIITEASVEAFSDSLHQVVFNRELQNELRHRGITQSKKYSGSNTASQTLGLYRNVLGQQS